MQQTKQSTPFRSGATHASSPVLMVGAKPVKPWLVLTAVLFGFFMAVLDMPQSGERIRGRDHMKAMQEAYPGPPTITVRRVVGSGDVWVVEGRSDYGGRIYHIANILEFREGKIIRETRYYADPFEAPAWRAQWVEPIEEESRTGKMASEERNA